MNGGECGSKRIKLSLEFSDQEGEVNSSTRSFPIGLKLSKTPSFLNLLQMTLSKEKQAGTSTHDNHVSYNDCNKPQTRKFDEKLKASNFPAIFIGIGAWQRVTSHEGDLVAKLYYAKRKLVWEVLDGGLKSKMEIQWSNISAISATTVGHEPGILEIELNEPPLFYRESSPQPRKHTLWQHATDFTGGQAPIWRRHCVKFPPGILDKHYEMLLQCDQRLFALNREPFPTHNSPYFDPNMFGFSHFNFNRLITFPRLHYPTTLSVMNFDVGKNTQFVANQNHTIWGDQGVSANVQGNQVHYNPQNYQPNMGLLSNIESLLLGDSQTVCSDEGTLREKVESMCSLLEPTNVINSKNNADDNTDQVITHDNIMDINPKLDGLYLENIVNPIDFNGSTSVEQTAFIFHGHPENGNF